MNTFQKGAAELAQLRQQAVDSHVQERAVRRVRAVASSARRSLPQGRLERNGSSRISCDGSVSLREYRGLLRRRGGSMRGASIFHGDVAVALCGSHGSRPKTR